MSLITCCPSCQTMFQVSGEDLRVSDGWVRCGNCNGVFDASAHLQAMPIAQPPAPPEPAPPSDRLAFEVVADHATDIAPVVAEAAMEAPRDELTPATFRREDQSARSPATQERVFISRHSPSRRSGRRLVYWLLTLFVLGAALLGWARHERQALVQHLPALLPALEGLCSVSACEVKAPRMLDVIVIDDLALHNLAPSEYKIQLVLKNTGSTPVELPSLKVTLTGQQGEILASHSASPLQFAPGLSRLTSNLPLRIAFNLPAAPAPAAVQAPASASASVSTSTAAEPAPAVDAQAPAVLPVSGYRVIAFYP